MIQQRAGPGSAKPEGECVVEKWGRASAEAWNCVDIAGKDISDAGNTGRDTEAWNATDTWM